MEFTIRPWQLSDIDSLVKHANNPKIAKFMTNGFPHPYTVEHGKKWIEMATKNSPSNFFAIIINGEAAGGIGIHVQQDIMCKNAELGYWLSENYWGNNIIPKVIPQIINYAFKTFDITRVYARPFGNNPASQRVLEKCGFKLEARLEKTIYKNEEFLDELIFAIRKHEII